MDKHYCDNINCNHNDTKGLCCLFNPDNCKYRQLQKENAELKGLKDIATLIRANNDIVITLGQLNNMLVGKNQQLTKAKELLKQWLQTSKASGCDNINIVTDTEQFLNSEVEK